MRNFLVISILLTLLNGCAFTRTIYVPHGQAVRLRETVKGVDVWVKTKEGELVSGKVDLPEGWYALPDPGEK